MKQNRIPFYVAMLSVVLLAGACNDDDDNKSSASEPSDFQKSINGTFVELFTDNGFTASKYDEYWIECCAKYVGDENAGKATSEMLKTSMTGTIYGPEAQAKYGDGTNGFPNGFQFNCYFREGVKKFVIDGKKITGLDADSKTLLAKAVDIIKECAKGN